jgi:hypothetical protein
VREAAAVGHEEDLSVAVVVPERACSRVKQTVLTVRAGTARRARDRLRRLRRRCRSGAASPSRAALRGGFQGRHPVLSVTRSSFLPNDQPSRAQPSRTATPSSRPHGEAPHHQRVGSGDGPVTRSPTWRTGRARRPAEAKGRDAPGW